MHEGYHPSFLVTELTLYVVFDIASSGGIRPLVGDLYTIALGRG